MRIALFDLSDSCDRETPKEGIPKAFLSWDTWQHKDIANIHASR